MNYRHFFPTLVSSVLVLTSCSNNNIAGITDTGNPPNGQVRIAAANGEIRVSARKGARVSAYQEDYQPHVDNGYSSTVFLDNADSCTFSSLGSAVYNVLVWDSSAGLASFTTGIPANPSADIAVLDTLDSTASISGTVKHNNAPMDSTLVYVPGSPFFDKTDDQGSFSLSHAPAGTLTIRAYQGDMDKSVSNDMVFAGDTTASVNPNSAVSIDIAVDKKSEDAAKARRVIIIHSTDLSTWKKDAYSISSVSVLNDVMTVEVSYGGGCKKHEFNLLVVREETSENRARMVLSHNGNDDACEAAITRELRFDLTPLKQAFPNCTIMSLELDGYDGIPVPEFRPQNPASKKVSISATDGEIRVRARKGVRVSAYHEDYQPHVDSGYSSTVILDNADSCTFSSLGSAVYHVLVWDSSAGLASFTMAIPVNPSTDIAVLDTLDSTASISGTVKHNDAPMDSALVYVPGSPFFDQTDDQGSFSLGHAPAGTLTIRAYQGDMDQSVSSDMVLAGDTAISANPNSPVSVDIVVDKKSDRAAKSERVVFIDSTDLASWKRDACTISNVSICSDVITVQVSYSGGCKTHEFNLLVLEERSTESHSRLVLSHNSNDDGCEAAITRELHFDLTPLKQAFPNSKTMSLTLEDYTTFPSPQFHPNNLPMAPVFVDSTGFTNWKRDDYDFVKASICNDVLKLTITYGGGCNDHDFDLLVSPVIIKTKPPQMGIVLAHNSNDDLCKALLGQELLFNFTSIDSLAQSHGGGEFDILLAHKSRVDTISHTF